MRGAGVVMDPESSFDKDWVRLTTTDPEVAYRFWMNDAAEAASRRAYRAKGGYTDDDDYISTIRCPGCGNWWNVIAIGSNDVCSSCVRREEEEYERGRREKEDRPAAEG
jgi:hypothetical protein